jgi:hypothetical protein
MVALHRKHTAKTSGGGTLLWAQRKCTQEMLSQPVVMMSHSFMRASHTEQSDSILLKIVR